MGHDHRTNSRFELEVLSDVTFVFLLHSYQPHGDIRPGCLYHMARLCKLPWSVHVMSLGKRNAIDLFPLLHPSSPICKLHPRTQIVDTKFPKLDICCPFVIFPLMDDIPRIDFGSYGSPWATAPTSSWITIDLVSPIGRQCSILKPSLSCGKL